MNDIDTLFERIQLINSKDAPDVTTTDIDDLVNFYRLRRTRKPLHARSNDTSALDTILSRPEPVTVAPGAVRRFRRV